MFRRAVLWLTVVVFATSALASHAMASDDQKQRYERWCILTGECGPYGGTKVKNAVSPNQSKKPTGTAPTTGGGGPNR
jgi:hypothetical protein